MTVSVNITTTSAATGDAALIMTIAARVRGMRRERELSLDRLAARSGVSKGMLVQIERGETNPSIGTLCKVAAALGASVADLVDLAATSRVSVIPAAAPRVLWKGARGGSAAPRRITGPDMLELWSWEMQPGERYDAIAHPSGTQGTAARDARSAGPARRRGDPHHPDRSIGHGVHGPNPHIRVYR